MDKKEEKEEVDMLEPVEGLKLGTNFHGIEPDVANRCLRAYRLTSELGKHDLDVYSSLQIDEIKDMVKSVFFDGHDPEIITPSAIEILEGIYTSLYDFSHDQRLEMYRDFCRKNKIDPEFDTGADE